MKNQISELITDPEPLPPPPIKKVAVTTVYEVPAERRRTKGRVDSLEQEHRLFAEYQAWKRGYVQHDDTTAITYDGF